MITCREVVTITTDYLEGKLSFAERVRFQLHLGMCSHCRAWLSQMKATIQVLGKLPAEEPPPEVRDELLERFRAWKKS
ncbi:MAG: zf-HC2 domain-containing protein [Deltaproteobacteria bacterium]|nr:zf-HC2 domain-containing protein [Deltaproteobacteria bacterium]